MYQDGKCILYCIKAVQIWIRFINTTSLTPVMDEILIIKIIIESPDYQISVGKVVSYCDSNQTQIKKCEMCYDETPDGFSKLI